MKSCDVHMDLVLSGVIYCQMEKKCEQYKIISRPKAQIMKSSNKNWAKYSFAMYRRLSLVRALFWQEAPQSFLTSASEAIARVIFWYGFSDGIFNSTVSPIFIMLVNAIVFKPPQMKEIWFLT